MQGGNRSLFLCSIPLNNRTLIPCPSDVFQEPKRNRKVGVWVPSRIHSPTHNSPL